MLLRLALFALAVALAPSALAQKTPPKASGTADVPAAQAVPAALGVWNYTLVMPEQEISGRIVVQRAAAGYKGSITTDGERLFTAVSLDGPMLTASFEQPGFGTAELDATVGDNGALAGTISAGGGAFPLTATRVAPDAVAARLVGRWRYEIEAPDGSRPFGTLVFEQNGARLKGRAIGFAESPFETLVVDGAHVVATFTPRGFSRVTVDVVLDGDTLTGTFSGIDPETEAPATLPLTAVRTEG